MAGARPLPAPLLPIRTPLRKLLYYVEFDVVYIVAWQQYQKKQSLKNSKDIQETERLLVEIDALEWLEAQIVVLSLGISSNNNNDPKAALGI
jgi:hypothetical protein